MKVLVLSNGELKEKEINNTLEELQKIVGGYIEIPFLSETFLANEIDIIINEEGKFIDGLRPEIAVVKSGTNTVLDVVFGNCIFASHDEDGNTIELSKEQVDIVNKELEAVAVLSVEGNDCLTKVLFVGWLNNQNGKENPCRSFFILFWLQKKSIFKNKEK